MSRKESYSDIILKHYKQPENSGEIDKPTIRKTLRNTLCGDEVTLYVNLSEDKIIRDIGFKAKGCMICKASASILCHTVKGIPLKEALFYVENVKELFQSDGKVEITEDDESEYLALQDVCKYPGRKKCALLAWNTFDKAISEYLSKN